MNLFTYYNVKTEQVKLFMVDTSFATFESFCRDFVFLQCLDAERIARDLKTDIYIFDQKGEFRLGERFTYLSFQLFRIQRPTGKFEIAYLPLLLLRNKFELKTYKSLINFERFNITEKDHLQLCLTATTLKP